MEEATYFRKLKLITCCHRGNKRAIKGDNKVLGKVPPGGKCNKANLSPATPARALRLCSGLARGYIWIRMPKAKNFNRFLDCARNDPPPHNVLRRAGKSEPRAGNPRQSQGLNDKDAKGENFQQIPRLFRQCSLRLCSPAYRLPGQAGQARQVRSE
jgi:hypothetical protein